MGLLTTLNEVYDRVAMHAVRRELVFAQAEAVGVELWIVDLPYPCSNEQYESIMGVQIEKAREARIDAIAFGDLFLEEVRAYREHQMAGTGIDLLFPIWVGKEPVGEAFRPPTSPVRPEGFPYRLPEARTARLAREMLTSGLRAYVTCVNPSSSTLPLLGGSGMRPGSVICRKTSIPAVRTASFILSF